MASFMRRKGVLLKDFGRFVRGPAQDLKDHAKVFATRHNRQYFSLTSSSIRKEELARQIAEEKGIRFAYFL